MHHRPKSKLQLNFAAWFWNRCPPKPQEQCFSWSGLVLFRGSLDSIPSVWRGAQGCHYQSTSCCLYLHAPGWGGGIYTIRSHFPWRLGLGCLAQCGCKGFAWGGRLSQYSPQGTGSRAKTSYWCEWSWSCWVGRCPLFLGHVMECLGYWARCGKLFIATLDSVRSWCRISDRSLCGPPSASCASLSSAQAKLMVWGVKASAPMNSIVRRASIYAMSLRSPGYVMDSQLRKMSVSK